MMVGFTGTRNGLRPVQHNRLTDVVSKLSLSAFVHGGCTGADTLAHYAVRESFPDIPIFILPADRDNGSTVTMPLYPEKNIILQPREPLERDRIIVRVVAGLVATPNTMAEELRSGTWYTIRQARKRGVPVLIVWPDGSLTIEENR
jgi:hypothetical protein